MVFIDSLMLTVMRIDRWDPRRHGPVTAVGLREKVESCGYQVSTVAWPAGTIVPAQVQDQERINAVVAGVVKITLDGESAILTAGDMVYIPRGAVRRIEVVGSAPAHCLDALFRQ
jgi:quercetin dioxygenase-like cupin family protein